MSYKVKLPTFEGPFDLLVYLIENAQMSIYDIRISEITSQYLEYVENMQTMNVNVSSEFMVLAAELIQIKSRMMLPRVEEEDGGIIAEDPRSELVERLIAYKACKKQAEFLKNKEDMMQGIFEKPQEDISVYLENPDEYLSLGVEDFAKAFDLFLRRKQKIEETRRVYERVERERESMESRIGFIRRTFKTAIKSGIKKLKLTELLPVGKKTRYDVIVTFASILQMMSERYLNAEQKKNYGEITVFPGKRDFDDTSEEERS